MIAGTLGTYLEQLEDPRIEAKCQHKLVDIVVIAVCATIAGADSWQEMEMFAQQKQAWLKKYLELANGIPSHDTMERVFRKLNSQTFDELFIAWTKEQFALTKGQVIAIDGKSVRGASRGGAKAKLHLVSAWSSLNGISLGQYKVEDKSNEITAIPHLLEALVLEGCIVTLDAMGCQRAIAEQIVEQQADYVLAVKKNQGNLYQHLEGRFAFLDDERFQHRMRFDYTQTHEQSHGRNETRQCWVMADEQVANMGWVNSQSIVRVVCERQSSSKVERETRYYISTLPPHAALLLGCIRAHWSIENSFHWVLDVTFGEDDAATREQTEAHNLAILRRVALNLLKQHPSKKSLRQKRYQATLNEDFLLEVLQS